MIRHWCDFVLVDHLTVFLRSVDRRKLLTTLVELWLVWLEGLTTSYLLLETNRCDFKANERLVSITPTGVVFVAIPCCLLLLWLYIRLFGVLLKMGFES